MKSLFWNVIPPAQYQKSLWKNIDDSKVKLNIDDNPATPGEFGIRGIPTLLLFKNGQVEAQKVGALSKGQLTAFIDSNI